MITKLSNAENENNLLKKDYEFMRKENDKMRQDQVQMKNNFNEFLIEIDNLKRNLK